jgi:hypothetical protein
MQLQTKTCDPREILSACAISKGRKCTRPIDCQAIDRKSGAEAVHSKWEVLLSHIWSRPLPLDGGADKLLTGQSGSLFRGRKCLTLAAELQ